MDKKWEDLTQEEKIEDLRKDMKTTMATVSAWIKEQQTVGASHNSLMNKHTETANRLSQALARIDPWRRCPKGHSCTLARVALSSARGHIVDLAPRLRGCLDHDINGALECGPFWAGRFFGI